MNGHPEFQLPLSWTKMDLGENQGASPCRLRQRGLVSANVRFQKLGIYIICLITSTCRTAPLLAREM